jgi:hypothetical protein
MVVRSKHSAQSVRQKPPLPKQAKIAMGAAAAVVVGVAAVIGVHVAATGPALAPLAGADHAGALELNASGSQLTSWNQTSTFCPANSFPLADGTVSTNSGGDATLSTTGKPNSCVGIVSPGTYSSGVIEADIDFPALPGKPGTIANWTALWMTNQDAWPVDGEIDAVEAEPATGVNAVGYHWGTPGSPQAVSTDGFAPDGNLPKDGPNLTPGWHTVDVVYTKGYFAVYYDGKQYTSASNSVVTGAALNIIVSSGVTANTSAVQKTLGGSSPKNSDSSPATLAIKDLRVWSYK